ncbi:carotenoid biosynthesis protein [Nocardia spumae]|uniref:carotenoid biosynthesis protein n=1 Tax=Nocardia spumae TaxID=2887190 RepID=UPI001D1580F5|nr:carotenoid biosynthesis protein [Nocardia spumae]
MTAARWPALTALAWVAAQIAYPLTDGAARDRVTVLVVGLSAATALLHARAVRGLGYAAGFLLIVAGLGGLAEMIGTASGFPFGCYGYADGRLGPELAGVPLLIPLAWVGGLYPIRVAAGLLCRSSGAQIALTAAGAVGWDLFLDPQMVDDGQWRWCSALPGLPGLSDIPYTNYLGWFAVAAVMTTLVIGLERRCPERIFAPAVPIAVLLWTWFGSALAHAAFLGLPVSALYGLIGLGVVAVPMLVVLVRAARTAGGGTRPGAGPDRGNPGFPGRPPMRRTGP